MKHTLVTGANRGLGLAFTTQLIKRGDYVFATHRPSADIQQLQELTTAFPDRLTLLALDVTDEAALPLLSEAIPQRTGALDIMINNAGILTDDETIETVRAEDLMQNFVVNAVAPLMIVQQLLPLLKQSDAALIVNITSSFASIDNKTSAMPTRYSYSMSKAALNMFTKTLAGEVEPFGIPVVAIHPGWTRTGIGGPQARFSPDEAVQAVIQTMDGISLQDTGRYLTWNGNDIAW